MFSKIWDLNTLQDRHKLDQRLDGHQRQIQSILNLLSQHRSLQEALLALQTIDEQMVETQSFLSCLMAENVADQRAVQLNGKMSEIQAQCSHASNLLDEQLANLNEADFQALLNADEMRGIAFHIKEKRRLAKEKLPQEQEKMISDLGVDGYHGWGELYPSLVGKIKIPFNEGLLSAGQAENKLFDPDRLIRAEMFQKWEETWTSQEDIFSQTLNRISGFRLKVYSARKWDELLKEPLTYNRMQRATLDAMWSAVERSKDIFVSYLHRKAQLLGLEKLAWFDVDAPLLIEKGKEYSFDEAAEMIQTHFRSFHPRMADFANEAFRGKWIEAENRPGKRPGGFCTSFPLSRQSRIFMTFSGTMNNISTLAHELGHAYHNRMVEGLPFLSQCYSMNVAETASTFAEMVVADSALKLIDDPKQQLMLLDDKIQRAVAFLMNIHSRFLFETEFYNERKKGMLLPSDLNELMEKAQKNAYCGALDCWHPHFWAAKMHFYFTDVPFYNFPYTFGYLFSLGIYGRAIAEGKSFCPKYDALLRDTGRMEVEDLAMKHLGVDLRQPDFWEEAIATAAKDVHQFLTITDNISTWVV